ncbi:hypothetical protein EJ02DRAFT_429889 [Clathrospora elynae]|uniref:Uncharacterized protein n=1 Tax=Clathrospora elynae TaxID=706981 RepID=A0A6A5T9M9_9PLEO|nr:hypothetical protein EJ02DRAFT_429889 [Clathrospora elynae]
MFVTIIQLKYDSGNVSTQHSNKASPGVIHEDLHALHISHFSNLRNLSLSEKLLADKGALDLSKLWGQHIGAQPYWAKNLETLTLRNVELAGESIQMILELPINLHIKGAVFLEDSFSHCEEPAKKNIRSATLSGLVVVTGEALLHYDRYIPNPFFLGKVPRVQLEDVAKYIMSGGRPPLQLENIWATLKDLLVSNRYNT